MQAQKLMANYTMRLLKPESWPNASHDWLNQTVEQLFADIKGAKAMGALYRGVATVVAPGASAPISRYLAAELCDLVIAKVIAMLTAGL